MESDTESETSEEIVQNEVRTCRMEDPCKGCINCAYKDICDFNMFCVLYSELISCERAFSKLKLIKTWLRSHMKNYNLEAFLIMQCERDKLVALDNDM
ncbi:hypothetical protein PR048_023720, partial [Dryococelus australis]